VKELKPVLYAGEAPKAIANKIRFKPQIQKGQGGDKQVLLLVETRDKRLCRDNFHNAAGLSFPAGDYPKPGKAGARRVLDPAARRVFAQGFIGIRDRPPPAFAQEALSPLVIGGNSNVIFVLIAVDKPLVVHIGLHAAVFVLVILHYGCQDCHPWL